MLIDRYTIGLVDHETRQLAYTDDGEEVLARAFRKPGVEESMYSLKWFRISRSVGVLPQEDVPQRRPSTGEIYKSKFPTRLRAFRSATTRVLPDASNGGYRFCSSVKKKSGDILRSYLENAPSTPK